MLMAHCWRYEFAESRETSAILHFCNCKIEKVKGGGGGMRTCIVRILEIIIEIRRQVVACPRLIFFFFGRDKSDFLAFLLSSQE